MLYILLPSRGWACHNVVVTVTLTPFVTEAGEGPGNKSSPMAVSSSDPLSHVWSIALFVTVWIQLAIRYSDNQYWITKISADTNSHLMRISVFTAQYQLTLIINFLPSVHSIRKDSTDAQYMVMIMANKVLTGAIKRHKSAKPESHHTAKISFLLLSSETG